MYLYDSHPDTRRNHTGFLSPEVLFSLETCFAVARRPELRGSWLEAACRALVLASLL